MLVALAAVLAVDALKVEEAEVQRVPRQSGGYAYQQPVGGQAALGAGTGGATGGQAALGSGTGGATGGQAALGSGTGGPTGGQAALGSGAAAAGAGAGAGASGGQAALGAGVGGQAALGAGGAVTPWPVSADQILSLSPCLTFINIFTVYACIYTENEFASNQCALLQPLMPYQFAYEVKDDATTNYHNRVEFVENGVLQGSFSLLSSDGVVRTYIYSDDGTSGFKVRGKTFF